MQEGLDVRFAGRRLVGGLGLFLQPHKGQDTLERREDVSLVHPDMFLLMYY